MSCTLSPQQLILGKPPLELGHVQHKLHNIFYHSSHCWAPGNTCDSQSGKTSWACVCKGETIVACGLPILERQASSPQLLLHPLLHFLQLLLHSRHGLLRLRHLLLQPVDLLLMLVLNTHQAQGSILRYLT